jgi:hypothetical protein
VVRQLGGLRGAKLYKVDQDPGSPIGPSTVEAIGEEPADRIAVLAELGYELYDFELYDGWVFLEESSAERIIRDFLIPWFFPRLSRVRTVAAGGVSEVGPMFQDFKRLFLFTHLEERYQDRAYVVVDGDEVGSKAVAGLRDAYPSTDPDRFMQFSRPQFEWYYPAPFKPQVEAALAEGDKKARREGKRILLDQVRAWLSEDEARGREALAQSAAEVIELLGRIDKELFG